MSNNKSFSGGISQRYALALLELSSEANKTDEYVLSLSNFLKIYYSDNNLKNYIKNPTNTNQSQKEVFEKILAEIKKEKIVDLKTITYTKMRDILKRLRINKYYEHINYIINRINGIPTPQFSPELEEKLCSMFRSIQAPFLKHCPKDRKNFLSYSYVLHKFVELLGLDEFLPCFPLLKSREKLLQQDRIWKLICQELKWEFIKSI